MTVHTSSDNKFWSTRKPAQPLPSSNRVIHREPDTYPGLVKAKDIFVNIPPSVMQAETGKRADTICQLMQDVIDGKLKWRDYINHEFHRTDVKLDAIQDKCKPYQKVV